MSDNDSPCDFAVSFSLAYMVALNLTAAVISLGPGSLLVFCVLLIVIMCRWLHVATLYYITLMYVNT